jgi:hypothetical protein
MIVLEMVVVEEPRVGSLVGKEPRMMKLMIISPLGHGCCGRSLRGMRCIHINQITTNVGTLHSRGFLAIHFI